MDKENIEAALKLTQEPIITRVDANFPHRQNVNEPVWIVAYKTDHLRGAHNLRWIHETIRELLERASLATPAVPDADEIHGLLLDIGQLMQVVEWEWKSQGAWTEYDQGVQDRRIAMIRRLSAAPKQDESVE